MQCIELLYASIAKSQILKLLVLEATTHPPIHHPITFSTPNHQLTTKSRHEIFKNQFSWILKSPTSVSNQGCHLLKKALTSSPNSSRQLPLKFVPSGTIFLQKTSFWYQLKQSNPEARWIPCQKHKLYRTIAPCFRKQQHRLTSTKKWNHKTQGREPSIISQLRHTSFMQSSGSITQVWSSPNSLSISKSVTARFISKQTDYNNQTKSKMHAINSQVQQCPVSPAMIHTHTISIGLIDWKMALIIKLYKLLQGLTVVATLEQINRTEARVTTDTHIISKEKH